jgi:NADH dehydrogenase (ubiquinone) 1 alpha subcomplex subunit 2
MKQSNPHTPIMIREALGIEPKVYARYEFGRERVADLKGEIWRCRRTLCQ